MSSSESELDLERIAAFIDGRLSEDERASVVKLLAESDEAAELFADAVLVQRDLAPAPRVAPYPGRPWWRRPATLVPLAAAATLAIIAWPTMMARRAQQDFGRPLEVLLALDSGFPTRLGAGWEQRGWSVTRGGARDARRPGPTLAFPLGVRTVDLQVALARGDREVAISITDDMLDALSAIDFAEGVTGSYRDLRSRLAVDPLPQLRERASAAEHVLDGFLESGRFSFGRWAGAAELAARTGNEAFFDTKMIARLIERAPETGDLSREDEPAMRRIEARVRQGLDDGALEGIGEELRAIIRRHGS